MQAANAFVAICIGLVAMPSIAAAGYVLMIALERCGLIFHQGGKPMLSNAESSLVRCYRLPPPRCIHAGPFRAHHLAEDALQYAFLSRDILIGDHPKILTIGDAYYIEVDG